MLHISRSKIQYIFHHCAVQYHDFHHFQIFRETDLYSSEIEYKIWNDQTNDGCKERQQRTTQIIYGEAL